MVMELDNKCISLQQMLSSKVLIANTSGEWPRQREREREKVFIPSNHPWRCQGHFAEHY
jgi:hypothetical protein